MRSFQGQFSSENKVDLRGRSRAEETREQVLERTRLERKRRQQQKLEQKSAASLQAFWRGRHEVDLAKAAVRQRWQSQYGERGEEAARGGGMLSSPLYRELCFFCGPADIALLVAACKPLLSRRDERGRGQCCGPLRAASVGNDVILLRAKQMAYLCAEAVLQHTKALQDSQAAHDTPAALQVLVDTVKLLLDRQTWIPAYSGDASVTAAAAVLEHLAPLLPRLSSAIIAESGLRHTLDSGSVQVIAAAGTLAPTEQLLMCFATGAAQLTSTQVAGRTTAWLPSLLCIPLLWDRYPVLKPAQSLIWRQVVEALHGLGSLAALIAWLPVNATLGGKAGAAAALLGNLAQAAGPSLGDKQLEPVWWRMVVQFANMMEQLLSIVPLQKLYEEEDDLMDEDGPSSSTEKSTPAMLRWEVPRNLVSSFAAQTQYMARISFLKPLISILLPVTSAAAAATSVEAATGRSIAEQGDAVNRLCGLLNAMLDVPALRQNTLIILAVNVEFVPRLWYSYLRDAHAQSSWQPSKDEACDPGWMLPLVIMSRTYSTFLSTFGDDYMYRLQRPLPLEELFPGPPREGLVSLLKFALWQVLWAESQATGAGAFSQASWTGKAATLRGQLTESAGALLGQLYDRNCRRAFAPAEAFQTEHLPPARFHSEVKAAAATLGGLMEARHTRVWAVLTHAPFLIPFEERARVFQTVIAADRRDRREMSAYGPQSFATIRRSSLMQDGYEKLNMPGEQLRGRIRIQYVDHYGEIEAGVDGGGLFKDFMENLVKEGFDPQIGLFYTTPEQKLYPNPAAAAAVPNAYSLIEFLGKMLGKALYEGILLELPLAGFFLKKLLRRGCDVNDLPSLDAELYRSLLILRDYEGDVEDLAITFTLTLTDTTPGANREIELVPGGRDRPVTNSNRLEYIHRVANFKLNTQIKRATDAFRKGLEDVIACEWINMFNEGELQALIGGGDHQGLDLEDMKQHVNYAGGYHPEHPVILGFWKALEGFTPEQQKAFLRFVTACSRPPLLGFKYLDPALCVQMAGGVLDGASQERLPSSSTCINLLKLPPYQSTNIIRQKLLLAVSNVAGFDLS